MSADEIEAEELSAEELAEIVDPATESLEMETEAAEEEVAAEEGEPEFTVTGLTSAVGIAEVGCATGATTAIRVPISAFYWSARLGYYRSDGARLGLSSIWSIGRSYYPPSVIRARFNGHLPSGMADLRAFWWYGPPGEAGPVYWNRVAARC